MLVQANSKKRMGRRKRRMLDRSLHHVASTVLFFWRHLPDACLISAVMKFNDEQHMDVQPIEQDSVPTSSSHDDDVLAEQDERASAVALQQQEEAAATAEPSQ